MSDEPAIFANGKIVTGANHGEAFGKLDDKEKSQPVQSGFYNSYKLKFTDEQQAIYFKKVLMIRHAEHKNKKMTEDGLNQIKKTANFVSTLNLGEYETLCSPLSRCIETAKIIFSHFNIDCNLVEQNVWESPDIFIKRIRFVLDYLPRKSVIISHCDFIEIMAKLNHINISQIPCGSVTYIKNSHPIWIARTF